MLGGFFLANIEEKVESLLQGKIEELGYELYDVEYAKEGKNYFLRIFINKENGIDLNDCEKVNDGITDLLDKADYIKEQYFLEVSSPGVERVLRKDKHLNSAMGEEIEVNLFKPIDKKKSLDGILTGYNEENITMICENDEISIERKNISLMKTKYNW
jgi:ribosome maturation factor RimP